MRDGFLNALLSVRLVACAALVAAYGTFALIREVNSGLAVNGWDVILPALTDSFTTSLIGMVFWATWVLPVMRSIVTPEALIRHGSRLRAVRRGTATLVGVLAAWGFYLAIVGVVLGIPVGLNPVWSDAARGAASGQSSAFAASSMVNTFGGPLESLVSSAAYTAVFYVTLSAFTLALACRGNVRAVQGGFIVFVVWSVICSFSPLPIPSIIDAVVPASLGWAMTIPGGVAAGVFVSLAIGGLAVLAAGNGSARETLQRFTQTSGGVLALGYLVAVLGALVLVPSSGESFVRLYFAGAHGDMLIYLLVAVLPAIYSTWVLSRAAERLGPRLHDEAIRLGSYRRWTRRIYTRQLIPAVGFTVAVGAGLVTTAALRGGTSILTDGPALGIGLSGLFIASQLLVVVAVVTIWLGASLRIAWPVIVGTSLVIGYSIPSNLGWLNIAAPYSLPAFPEPAPVLAVLVSAALTVVAIGATILLSSPANADHLLRDQ